MQRGGPKPDQEFRDTASSPCNRAAKEWPDFECKHSIKSAPGRFGSTMYRRPALGWS